MAKTVAVKMVPRAGVEPARGCSRQSHASSGYVSRQNLVILASSWGSWRYSLLLIYFLCHAIQQL